MPLMYNESVEARARRLERHRVYQAQMLCCPEARKKFAAKQRLAWQRMMADPVRAEKHREKRRAYYQKRKSLGLIVSRAKPAHLLKPKRERQPLHVVRETQKLAAARWRERNKDRVAENRLRSHAKESLKRSCGVPLEMITDCMVKAKMEQLRVLKALKELSHG